MKMIGQEIIKQMSYLRNEKMSYIILEMSFSKKCSTS